MTDDTAQLVATTKAPNKLDCVRLWLERSDPALLARIREQRGILHWWNARPRIIEMMFLRLDSDGDVSNYSCEFRTCDNHLMSAISDALTLCEGDGLRARTIDDLLDSDPNWRACLDEGSILLAYV